MESGRAPFQSHTGRFFEGLKTPGRDGRACGPPQRRWGRALFVRPIGRGCRCDGKRGPAVWSVLFCHPEERLHKKTVVSRFLYSDGVGACPRQARPGRPGGIDSKRGCCTECAAPPFSFIQIKHCCYSILNKIMENRSCINLWSFCFFSLKLLYYL